MQKFFRGREEGFINKASKHVENKRCKLRVSTSSLASGPGPFNNIPGPRLILTDPCHTMFNSLSSALGPV